MDIKGKHILLTGGSLGIGKETARQLVEKGAKVLITGRNQERVEAAASDIGAIPLVFDISDISQIESKVKDALSLLDDKIDVLINNAGIGRFNLLGEISIEDFMKVYNTNVFGLAMLTQEIAKGFVSQNYGHILNIGSTASLKGFAQGTVYASSKFALRGMTQCWQAELRKHNVRVGLICPSEVTTAFGNEERKERQSEDNKLRAAEIAHSIVSFLEMDDRGFIPELSVWATNPF